MALSPDILSMFPGSWCDGGDDRSGQRVYRGNPCMADPLYDAVYAGKSREFGTYLLLGMNKNRFPDFI